MDDDDDDYWAQEQLVGRRSRNRVSINDDDSSSSRGMLLAEATLQAALRFLAAAADLILGSAPDPQEELRQLHQQQQQQQQQRRRGRGRAEEEQRRQQQEQSWLLVRLIATLWAGFRKLLGSLLAVGTPSSFWFVGIFVLVVCLLFSAYRSGVRLFRIVEQVEVPRAPTPSSASSSSSSSSQKRLLLPDGRTVAYREHGVTASKAKHSALLVQGIPKKPTEVVQGLNQTLLHEFRVRLVSYDLPGFGASDANPRRSFKTSAQDMADIADVLGFGDRFWLLVYPGGGPLAWAAIRYIPLKLEGIVMLGPAEDDNPYTTGNLIDLEDEYVLPEETSTNFRTLFFLARHFPWLARLFVDTKAISNRVTRIHQGLYAAVADTERVLWQQKEFIAFWEENLRQTQVQRKPPKGAKELPYLEELLRLLSRPKSSSSTSTPSSTSSWSSWVWATLNWLVPGFFKSRPVSSKRREDPSSTTTSSTTSSTPFPSLPSLDLFKHKLFLVVLVLLLIAVVLRS